MKSCIRIIVSLVVIPWSFSAFGQHSKFFIQNFPPAVCRNESHITNPLNWFIRQDHRGINCGLNTTGLLQYPGCPATFAFTILQPWYRAWWAYLALVVFLVGLVYMVNWQNQKRLIRETRQLEVTLKQRTQQLEEKTAELERALINLKETQGQLVQSEKMASLGQLTAGVAHEINNPVNFVAGNVNPLRRDIQELMDIISKYNSVIEEKELGSHFSDINYEQSKNEIEFLADEIRMLIYGIEQSSGRTADIVRGLRNFSRTDENDLKKTNLNEGLDTTLMLLYNKYKERIEVVRDYDAALPAVECFPGPINQVFMNILVNAIDAIEGDGKIFIRSQTKGHHACITIRDTGIGMSRQTLSKIFDPFFTTKPVGVGTGLGLPISNDIIKKHHGKISVTSEEGMGTTFTIILPLSQPREGDR